MNTSKTDNNKESEFHYTDKMISELRKQLLKVEKYKLYRKLTRAFFVTISTLGVYYVLQKDLIFVSDNLKYLVFGSVVVFTFAFLIYYFRIPQYDGLEDEIKTWLENLEKKRFDDILKNEEFISSSSKTDNVMDQEQNMIKDYRKEDSSKTKFNPESDNKSARSTNEKIVNKELEFIDENKLIDNIFIASIERLRLEIVLLTRRANLNLIIGITMAAGGLVVLGTYSLNEVTVYNENLEHFLKYMVRRFGLVILIETFSFYFLNLFRSNISEVKYYQNELSNIQLKQISLYTARSIGNEDDKSGVIKELSQTERNFKLQKDESTVEIEKSKHDNQTMKDFIQAFAGAIPKTNKSK